MGIIKRQGLKSSIVNYVGVLIGVVFFNFVFPNIVSKEYLGLISLLQYLMYFLISIPTLGLGNILLSYYSVWDKNDKEKINQFNAFALLMMSAASIVVGILYIYSKDTIISYYALRSPLLLPYYFVVIPMFIAYTFNLYFEYFALVKLRSAVPAFLREIVNRVILIVLVYLFIYKVLSEKQFVWSISIAYILPFIILLIYSIKILNFRAKSPLKFLRENHSIKPQLLFGGGIFLLGIFATVHNFLDGIILPAYLGLGALGIYMRPLVLGQMIQVPYRAIASIASPILREAIINNDLIKLKELNKNLSTNLFLIGCFLFSLLIANAEGIFSLLPKEFSEAIKVLYIIAFGRLVDMGFGLNTELITYSKNYKYIVVLSALMMLMTIILNILFIPRFGMNGAAMAVSISLVVFNLLKTYLIYKKYHFHCFSKHYITLILITLSTLVILHFIPFIQFVEHHKFYNPLLNIVFKTIIGIMLFLFPTYYFNVSPDFNDFFKLVVSGKIFKGGHKMENL